MVDTPLGQIVLNKVTAPAVLLMLFVSMGIFLLIGQFSAGQAVKIGPALTLVFMGVSVAIAWQLFANFGRKTTSSLGRAPVGYGFLVLVGMLIVSLYVLPTQFEQFYSVVGLKSMLLSIVSP